MSTIVFELFIVCVVFRSPWFVFFSHSFNTFDKHLFTGISMVICKIGSSIRSWLSDYISFCFYKSHCRHDIYWILVAFMIVASALIDFMDCTDICIRNWYIDIVLLYCIPMWIYWINVSESWILNPKASQLGFVTSMTHCNCDSTELMLKFPEMLFVESNNRQLKYVLWEQSINFQPPAAQRIAPFKTIPPRKS